MRLHSAKNTNVYCCKKKVNELIIIKHFIKLLCDWLLQNHTKPYNYCRLVTLRKWWWMPSSTTNQTLCASLWTMGWTWGSSSPTVAYRSFTGLCRRRASFTICFWKNMKRSSSCLGLQGHLVRQDTIPLSKGNPASPCLKSPKSWRTFCMTPAKAFIKRCQQWVTYIDCDSFVNLSE